MDKDKLRQLKLLQSRRNTLEKKIANLENEADEISKELKKLKHGHLLCDETKNERRNNYFDGKSMHTMYDGSIGCKEYHPESDFYIVHIVEYDAKLADTEGAFRRFVYSHEINRFDAYYTVCSHCGKAWRIWHDNRIIHRACSQKEVDKVIEQNDWHSNIEKISLKIWDTLPDLPFDRTIYNVHADDDPDITEFEYDDISGTFSGGMTFESSGMF